MNFDFKSLTQKKVKIGDTEFMFGKLNALDGFFLLESIREQLGESLGRIDFSEEDKSGTKAIEQFIVAVLKLPKKFVKEELMPPLFKQVNYVKGTAPIGMELEGTEAMAFEGLDALQVYEVLVRSLCVNFYQSFAGKISNLTAKTKS